MNFSASWYFIASLLSLAALCCGSSLPSMQVSIDLTFKKHLLFLFMSQPSTETLQQSVSTLKADLEVLQNQSDSFDTASKRKWTFLNYLLVNQYCLLHPENARTAAKDILNIAESSDAKIDGSFELASLSFDSQFLVQFLIEKLADQKENFSCFRKLFLDRPFISEKSAFDKTGLFAGVMDEFLVANPAESPLFEVVEYLVTVEHEDEFSIACLIYLALSKDSSSFSFELALADASNLVAKSVLLKLRDTTQSSGNMKLLDLLKNKTFQNLIKNIWNIRKVFKVHTSEQPSATLSLKSMGKVHNKRPQTKPWLNFRAQSLDCWILISADQFIHLKAEDLNVLYSVLSMKTQSSTEDIINLMNLFLGNLNSFLTESNDFDGLFKFSVLIKSPEKSSACVAFLTKDMENIRFVAQQFFSSLNLTLKSPSFYLKGSPTNSKVFFDAPAKEVKIVKNSEPTKVKASAKSEKKKMQKRKQQLQLKALEQSKIDREKRMNEKEQRRLKEIEDKLKLEEMQKNGPPVELKIEVKYVKDVSILKTSSTGNCELVIECGKDSWLLREVREFDFPHLSASPALDHASFEELTKRKGKTIYHAHSLALILLENSVDFTFFQALKSLFEVKDGRYTFKEAHLKLQNCMKQLYEAIETERLQMTESKIEFGSLQKEYLMSLYEMTFFTKCFNDFSHPTSWKLSKNLLRCFIYLQFMSVRVSNNLRKLHQITDKGERDKLSKLYSMLDVVLDEVCQSTFLAEEVPDYLKKHVIATGKALLMESPSGSDFCLLSSLIGKNEHDFENRLREAFFDSEKCKSFCESVMHRRMLNTSVAIPTDLSTTRRFLNFLADKTLYEGSELSIHTFFGALANQYVNLNSLLSSSDILIPIEISRVILQATRIFNLAAMNITDSPSSLTENFPLMKALITEVLKALAAVDLGAIISENSENYRMISLWCSMLLDMAYKSSVGSAELAAFSSLTQMIAAGVIFCDDSTISPLFFKACCDLAIARNLLNFFHLPSNDFVTKKSLVFIEESEKLFVALGNMESLSVYRMMHLIDDLLRLASPTINVSLPYVSNEESKRQLFSEPLQQVIMSLSDLCDISDYSSFSKAFFRIGSDFVNLSFPAIQSICRLLAASHLYISPFLMEDLKLIAKEFHIPLQRIKGTFYYGIPSFKGGYFMYIPSYSACRVDLLTLKSFQFALSQMVHLNEESSVYLTFATPASHLGDYDKVSNFFKTSKVINHTSFSKVLNSLAAPWEAPIFEAYTDVYTNREEGAFYHRMFEAFNGSTHFDLILKNLEVNFDKECAAFKKYLQGPVSHDSTNLGTELLYSLSETSELVKMLRLCLLQANTFKHINSFEMKEEFNSFMAKLLFVLARRGLRKQTCINFLFVDVYFEDIANVFQRLDSKFLLFMQHLQEARIVSIFQADGFDSSVSYLYGQIPEAVAEATSVIQDMLRNPMKPIASAVLDLKEIQKCALFKDLIDYDGSAFKKATLFYFPTEKNNIYDLMNEIIKSIPTYLDSLTFVLQESHPLMSSIDSIKSILITLNSFIKQPKPKQDIKEILEEMFVTFSGLYKASKEYLTLLDAPNTLFILPSKVLTDPSTLFASLSFSDLYLGYYMRTSQMTRTQWTSLSILSKLGKELSALKLYLSHIATSGRGKKSKEAKASLTRDSLVAAPRNATRKFTLSHVCQNADKKEAWILMPQQNKFLHISDQLMTFLCKAISFDPQSTTLPTKSNLCHSQIRSLLLIIPGLVKWEKFGGAVSFFSSSEAGENEIILSLPNNSNLYVASDVTMVIVQRLLQQVGIDSSSVCLMKE